MTSSVVSFFQVATPLATLLLTGAIALVTLRIQRQQTETNKNQLRFHLFDRRWAVYEATMALIDVAITKGDIPREELWKFAVATRGARFLFNQEEITWISCATRGLPYKWASF
jgi:hypothetical protein